MLVKDGAFVGKEYMCDNMFKLNINKTDAYAYIVGSFFYGIVD